MKWIIPADVPSEKKEIFNENMKAITHDTGNLFMFSCDQKIEHLNDDMFGKGIPREVNNPEHFFSIAAHAKIGAMATNPGLIARYAPSYPFINYIAKLNGKTNSISSHRKDPISSVLWSVDDILKLKTQYNIPIRGVGFTLYVGSMYEDQMLTAAAQVVFNAHQAGLVAIIWGYARGSSITDEHAPELIAGICGLANVLGADFVKIKPPRATRNYSSLEALSIAQEAAGNTKVLSAGGSRIDEKNFLETIYKQLHEGHIAGAAIGRNIFQQTQPEAIAMAQALSALIYDDATVSEAHTIWESHLK